LGVGQEDRISAHFSGAMGKAGNTMFTLDFSSTAEAVIGFLLVTVIVIAAFA